MKGSAGRAGQRFVVAFRYGKFVLGQFITPICVLVCIVAVGGLAIHFGYHDEELPITDSMFAAFAATFFEIIINPPYPWYIEALLVVAPLTGLFIVADSIAIIGNMLFQKKHKLQEWWIMTASTYSGHVIVCGVGKVGYRIINELVQMGELVVGIEKLEKKDFVQELREKGIPIICGSCRIKSVLEHANVKNAKVIICVTNDDLTNIDAAFTAREVNPDIRTVLRIFDDTIAAKISSQFKMPAISTSYAAAPAFVTAALGLDVTQTSFRFLDHNAVMNSAIVTKDLAGNTVEQFEKAKGVRIVGLEHSGIRTVFPPAETQLAEGDIIIFIGLEERVNQVKRETLVHRKA